MEGNSSKHSVLEVFRQSFSMFTLMLGRFIHMVTSHA